MDTERAMKGCRHANDFQGPLAANDLFPADLLPLGKGQKPSLSPLSSFPVTPNLFRSLGY